MGYFLSVFFGTFILEDVALASALALIFEGKLNFYSAFFACFLGISVGDLLLYLLGFIASKFQLETRFPGFKKYHQSLIRLRRSPILTYSIVISRIIPGTRLPTYLGAGYLRYPFFRFLFLTIASVFLWVWLALIAGRSLQSVFMDHWVLTMVVFLVGLQLLKSIVPKLMNHWDRKALLHSWRRWTHFEFWPAWAFYLPIVPYYLYLSFKHRSLLMPFYASPGVAHGGLIGESKWDYLQHLKLDDPATLKTVKISRDVDFMGTKEILDSESISFPFIMKPDVGQRGFGVRVIRDDFDLTEYLLLSDFERIIQVQSALPSEAGLFYIRKPSEKFGTLFSITDKTFPFVTGDGVASLGALILRDKRARIIAPVYFERHRAELDTILEREEKFSLAECGNHCQGAIFLNGNKFSTPTLLERLERISRTIPDFYFGRFDVRYLDAESLKKGQHFEIVEVNGAGSEATHIWDSKTKLLEAYKTLFAQWALLFEIGSEVRRMQTHPTTVQIGGFLKECAKVVFRKNRLSVSS